MKTYKSEMPEITLKYKSGNIKKVKIISSNDVFELSKKMFNQDTLELTEEFICIYLNRQNNSIGWFRLSKGGITSAIVDIRIIYATALQCGATSLIIMHNHPSGNIQPSTEDVNLTKKVNAAGEVLDIKLLDHIIVTTDKYYSFADEGII